jgi:prepilin-type N-terminal cleavage/methylation domain-containing protein
MRLWYQAGAKLARGFTLIEMAIVMVIIGLLLSGGLVAVAPVIQNSKVAETNQRLDRIEQALILHVIRNGCLPCPADPSLTSTNSNAGRANDNGTYYPPVTGTASACAATSCQNTLGVVPWINLGLSEPDVTDGFGARIAYSVAVGVELANGMVRTPPATYPAPTTGIQINNYSGVEQTGGTAATRAAYALISYGPDRFQAYLAVSGTQITQSPNSSSAHQTENDGTDRLFQQDDFHAQSGSTYFDDIVRWRTAPMIIQLCGTNACGNPP